jgi:hypothetical protein
MQDDAYGGVWPQGEMRGYWRALLILTWMIWLVFLLSTLAALARRIDSCGCYSIDALCPDSTPPYPPFVPSALRVRSCLLYANPLLTFPTDPLRR